MDTGVEEFINKRKIYFYDGRTIEGEIYNKSRRQGITDLAVS